MFCSFNGPRRVSGQMFGGDQDKMEFLDVQGVLRDWIWTPLVTGAKWVYFNGPSKLGLWHGASQHEACATLTRVDADVWKREEDACEQLLARDFRAACIGVGLITGLLVVWKALDACMLSCAFRQLRKHD